MILDQLAFYKKAHHKEKRYQVWEEGYQPKLIQSDKMMKIKIDYNHNNPVKRGYVDVLVIIIEIYAMILTYKLSSKYIRIL